MEMLLLTNFWLQRVFVGKNRSFVFIFQRSRWRSLVGHNVSLTPIRSPVQVRALVRTPFFIFLLEPVSSFLFALASFELSFCSVSARLLETVFDHLLKRRNESNTHHEPSCTRLPPPTLSAWANGVARRRSRTGTIAERHAKWKPDRWTDEAP